jgi:hypothetical protein
MSLRRWLRDLPGVVLRDLPVYWRAFAHSGPGHRSDPEGWIALSNRAETLRRAGHGYECEWTWGSELRAAAVLPRLARRMLAVSLAEWPIGFAERPKPGAPQVSFIFAHGGRERLLQLRTTIRAVFAQTLPCEVIVVDQSETPLAADLPGEIRYRHLSKEGVAPGWYKSWAYNVGARIASAPILVFHDGDTLPPTAYAQEVLDTIDGRGFAAASIQRFLYYLNEWDSTQVQSEGAFAAATPTMVFQNWKGGTIAIRRDAFFATGGYDESFVNWGGEDDEFYDRLADIGHCRSGYLPFVHLWHRPQANKADAMALNAGIRLPNRLAMVRSQRIAELLQRQTGRFSGPGGVEDHPAQEH